MRRSGSSSCMLKPKASMKDLNKDIEPPLSVTMVNNTPLPTYSTERFYMLSEIELHGYATLFLCDHSCDYTPETTAAEDDDDDEEEEDDDTHCDDNNNNQKTNQQSLFPSHIILYILWRPEMASSPKALTQGIIQDAVKQVKALTDSTRDDPCKLYLVVDLLADTVAAAANAGNASRKLPLSLQSSTAAASATQRRYESQVDTAALLARCITTSKSLRDDLQGLTIGISNHVRAAPGLEKCMESILWGSKDRRQKDAAGVRSPIGIVTHHPDDLVGLEPSPDAAQGVLQSITCAEWNGNGNLMCFAKRAHVLWCAANDVVLQEENPPKPKVLPRRYQGRDLDSGLLSDPMTIFLCIAIVSWIYLHISTSYGDGLFGFLNKLESMLSKHEGQDDPPNPYNQL